MRKLLDAAMTVFESAGTTPARVDDIVKVAKTSHGTFYLLRQQRGSLSHADHRRGRGDATLAESLGPSGQRRGRAEGFANGWPASPTSRAYGPASGPGPKRRPTPPSSGGSARRAANFPARSPTGSGHSRLGGLDPQVAALALVAMIERFNYYVYSGQVAADRDELVDTLADVTWAAMFGAAVP